MTWQNVAVITVLVVGAVASQAMNGGKEANPLALVLAGAAAGYATNGPASRKDDNKH